MKVKHLCDGVVFRFTSFAGITINSLLFFLLTLPISTTSFAQQFTATSLGDYGNVSVMEVTGAYDSNNPDGTVNSASRAAITTEFFRAHKDEYDFLVIFTNFDFLMPDDGKAKAFYMGVKNDTEGIGQKAFTNATFGSNRLQGSIDMGNISTITSDPLDPKFDDTLYTLSHELMHRWGAYVKFRDTSGVDSLSLLGKDGSHWSFLFDSGGSVLYGNRWQDNGNGTFTSLAPQQQLKYFSPLDLYLMGMTDKSKVPPMLLIENPSVDSARLPEAGVTISGTAKTVTIDDIIAANGPRSPDAAASQKNFKTAFILVTTPGSFTGQEIYSIENIRNGFVTRHSILTDGQSIVEVASTPKEDVPAKPGVLPPSITPRNLPPDINHGVVWLIGNQNPEGNWSDLTETMERDTAVTVLTLKNFAGAQASYTAGLQWLALSSSGNTDFLSRKIEAYAAGGLDHSGLMTELLSRGNSDNGWGSDKIYASNAADTAIALKTLAVTGYADQSVLTNAIGYLKSHQKPDGGWTGNGESTIQATANALLAFSKYRKAYALEDPIAKASAWLLTKQNSDGGFGNSPSTVYDTALAILALRELNASTDITNKGLEYLLSQQAENGSWNQSAYQTALAVNAVYKATVDPDLSIESADISFIPASITQLPANIVINASIWNTGSTAVPQARVVLYEGSISDATKLGEQTVAFPGQQATTATFSTTIRDGNEHRYYIVVDPDNLVKEVSEANNSAFNVIRPEATYDFEILTSDVTVSPNPINQFEDVKITAKISNKGAMNAYNVKVKYFIDESANPYEIGTMTVDIPANTTVMNEVTWRASKTGANMPVTIYADPYSNFTELSETNNKASISLSVNAVNLVDPNLTISYRDIAITPTPAHELGSVNISALIKNEGYSPASNIAVNFYSGVPGPNGLLLGSQTIAALAPGESGPVSIEWTNIQESGEKIIYVQAVYSGVEIQKDDNDAFSTLNILSLPDLTILPSSLRFDPSLPKEGDPLAIRLVVQNAGEQPAQGVIVKLLDGYTEVQTKSIGELAALSQVELTFSYETEGKQGVHELSIVIDPDNTIRERSEQNNQITKSLSVQNANLWLTEQYISPNGDGIQDSTQAFFRLSSPTTVMVNIVDKNNVVIRKYDGGEYSDASEGTIKWDGLNDKGMVVDDGQYQIKITDTDNQTLGSLLVIVDNNRSPLTEAIGTDYLFAKNMDTNADIYGSRHWAADESGLFITGIYYAPNNSAYDKLKIYYQSLAGGDYQSIYSRTGFGWYDGISGIYPSPVSSLVALSETYRSWTGDLAFLELIDYSKKERKFSLELYGRFPGTLKWSPDGKKFAYNHVSSLGYNQRQAGLSMYLLDDGNKVLSTINYGSVSKQYQFAWSPDGTSFAYHDVSSNQIIITDGSGNNGVPVFTIAGQIDSIEWLDDRRIVISQSGYGTVVINLMDQSYALISDLAGPILSPDKQGLFFIKNTDKWNSGIVVLRPDGTIVGTHDLRYTADYYYALDPRPTWSPAGNKIALAHADKQGQYIIVYDSETGDAQELTESNPSIIGWLNPKTLAYYVRAYYPDKTMHVSLKAYETQTRNSSVLSEFSYPCDNCDPGSMQHKFLISPFGNYVSGTFRNGNTSQYYVLGSLMNLSVSLNAAQAGSGIILTGTASDLNIAGWKLEYALSSIPNLWRSIVLYSDLPVVDDIFAQWIPPSDGNFIVRLTAWDKAGNTKSKTVNTSWGVSTEPAITGLSKTPEMISPNGDGVNDEANISYTVLSPSHLEFRIFDSSGRLVRTLTQDEPISGPSQVLWDARDETLTIVPDGAYLIRVLDYELSITVDTKPPKVSLSMTGIYQNTEENGLSYRTALAVLFKGYAVDEQINEWAIQRDTHGEWITIITGQGPIAASASNGDVDLEYPTEIKLGQLFNTWDATDYRYRIEARDYAGNSSSIIAQLPQEEAAISVQRGTDGQLFTSSGRMPAGTDTAEVNLMIDDLFYGDETPAPLIIDTSHTIREQIERASLQYYYPPDGKWVDAETRLNPSKQNQTFQFNVSPYLPYLLEGVRSKNTIDNYFKIRGSFVDALGNVFYTHTVKLYMRNGESKRVHLNMVTGGMEDTECGADNINILRINARMSSYDEISLVNGGGYRIPLITGFTLTLHNITNSTEEVIVAETYAAAQTSVSLSRAIDSSQKEEGIYELKAQIFTSLSSKAEEVLSQPIYIDRHGPVASIQYPHDGEQACPTEVRNAQNQQRFVVPFEVTATDNLFLSDFKVYYSSADDPANWIEATILDGRNISGLQQFSGTLFALDVTDIKTERIVVKLKIKDRGGNWTCRQFSLVLDKTVSIEGPVLDTTIFSPNGDGILDAVSAAFTVGETAVINAEVYVVKNYINGAPVLGDSPIIRLADTAKYATGTYSVLWNGRNESDATSAEGSYVIRMTARDLCGNAYERISKPVDLDVMPPLTEILYPATSSVLANIVEVKGSAYDLHFQKFELEAGPGENPATWTVIANQFNPVQGNLLGQWNTFGLEGKYTIRLTALDTAGNKKVTSVQTTIGVKSSCIKDVSIVPRIFSPNNDGKLDAVNINYELSADCSIKAEIRDSMGLVRKSFTLGIQQAGGHVLVWSGEDNANQMLLDGVYEVRMTGEPTANSTEPQIEIVTMSVDKTAPFIEFDRPVDNSYQKGDEAIIGAISDENLASYAVSLNSPSGLTILDQGAQSRSNHVFGTMNNLSEGGYTLRITAKDIAENQVEKNIGFTIDRTPPVVKLEAPKEGDIFGSVRNTVAISGSINENYLDSFSLKYGLGDNPTQWKELLNGSSIPTSTLKYTWNVDTNSGISDGLYTLVLSAKDKAGATAEARITITVDNTAPETMITYPGEGGYVKGPLEIRGTAYDLNIEKYVIDFSEGQCGSAFKWSTIKTGALSVKDGVLETWRTIPPDGSYCLRVTASDKNGKTADAKVNVKVDTLPPTAPVLAGVVENKTGTYLSWSCNKEQDIAGYNVYRNNQKANAEVVSSCELRDQNSPEGMYSYTVKAVDFAGGVSSASNEVRLKIDLTGPDAIVQSPLANAKVSGIVEIKGTAYSADDFKQYRVYVGQGANPITWSLVRTSPVPISNDTLMLWDTFGVVEGAYSIKLETEDILDNIKTDQVLVTVDSTSPSAPTLISVKGSGSNANIAWNANAETDLAGYLLYKNDQLVNASSAGTGDIKPYLLSKTAYADQNLPDGTFRYYLIAVDQAGNMSGQSNKLDVTIDVRAPKATIVQPIGGTKIQEVILVKAEVTDLDIVKVQFEFKKASVSTWTALGAPVTMQPYTTYFDPAIYGYGDFDLRAVAVDKGGKKDPWPSSVTVSYADINAPAEAVGLQVVVNGKNAALTWIAGEESDINGYNIYRTRETIKTKINTSIVKQTNYQDPNLGDGVYVYEVTAIDNYNNESAASQGLTARVYAPRLPGSRLVTSNSAVSITGSNAASAASVEVFSDLGTGPISQGVVTADDLGNFTAKVNLVSGNNRITSKAVDNAGNMSRISDEFSVIWDEVPAIPTGLVASAQNYNVHLEWKPNKEADLFGYKLFKNGQSVTTSALITSATTTASSYYPYQYYDRYVPSKAFDGSSYTYWLSNYSNGPSTPQWWEMSFDEPQLIKQIEIVWLNSAQAGMNYDIQFWSDSRWQSITKVTGNGNTSNSYLYDPTTATNRIRLYITDTISQNINSGVAISEVRVYKDIVIKSTSYDELSLKDGNYSYSLVAVDSYGLTSAPTDTVSLVVGDIVPPAAPSGLTGMAVDSDVLLNWGQNPESDVAGYNVYRMSSGSWTMINTTIIKSGSFVDIKRSNGEYRYRIVAIDSVGNISDPSVETVVTVKALTLQSPIITDVNAVPEGKALLVSWTGTDNASGYNVYRSLSSGGSRTRINNAQINTQEYRDAGLENGAQYYYIVAAIDVLGNEGALSAEATGTPADIIAPIKPSIFYPTVPTSSIVVDSDHIDIAGDAEPGSWVEIFVNSGSQGVIRAREQNAYRTISLDSYVNGGFDILRNGLSAVYSSSTATIKLIELSAGTTIDTGQKGYYPKYSPDGAKILYLSSNKLYIYDVIRGVSAPLSGESYTESGGSWSSDSLQVAFRTNRSGSAEIWIKDIESGNLRQVTKSGYASEPKWSPDGKHIAYRDSSSKIYYVSLENNTTTFIDAGSTSSTYEWSPDARNITYSKSSAIWYFDVTTQQKTLLSPSGSSESKPVWSPDGKSILLIYYDNVLKKYSIGKRTLTTGELTPITPGGVKASPSDLLWSLSGKIVYTQNNMADLIELKGLFQVKDVWLTANESAITAVSQDDSGHISPGSDSINIIYDTSQMPDVEVTTDDIYLYPPYPLTGKDVALDAVVWNRSKVEVKDVEVDLYLWDSIGNLTPLKSSHIPSIAAGEGVIVDAPWNSGGNLGVNTVIVVVDPVNAIEESRELNNLAMKEITVVSNENIVMFTSVDAENYKVDQSVKIRLDLRNPGKDKTVTVQTSVEDAAGNIVTTFDEQSAQLTYGQVQNIELSWNIGSTFAGTYKVHAILRDETGVITEKTAPFTITPEVSIDSVLTTNKSAYGPNETAVIGATISNLGRNIIIPELKVQVRIMDAAGREMLSEDKAIYNFLPGGTLSLSSQWNMGLNTPGVYAVVESIIYENQIISTKAASFTIKEVADISGTITVSPAAVETGSAALTTLTLQNRGNADAAGLLVKVLILDPGTGEQKAEVWSQETRVRRGESITDTVTLPTEGLALKNYNIILQYSDSVGTETLDSSSFTVMDLTPPVVAITAPLADTTYNATIPLSALVTDDAAGVDRVEFRIDNAAWKLMPVADPSVCRYATAWEPLLSDNGTHTVSVRATDKAGNASAPISVNIIIQMDSEPPVTVLTIGEPRYAVSDSIFVNGNTAISLTATDNFSGVAKIKFRIDNGTWSSYAAPFALNGLSNGTHQIFYRSSDNAGNSEVTREISIVLDTTPPSTAISASVPLVADAVNTVSPFVFFTLSSEDTSSGVRNILYRIDEGQWQVYTGIFSLADRSAGQHTISYKAKDNVLNDETETAIIIRLAIVNTVNKSISVEPAVLVGVWSDNSDLEQKQADIEKLDTLLASLRVTYSIAQTMKDFTAALRSGRYNTYILIDVKDPVMSEEVREAVHFGDGLIFLKTRQDADPFLDDVFGVKLTGKTTSQDLTADLITSPVSNEGILHIVGKAIGASVTADTAAVYGAVTDKQEISPVIVFNQYGRGRAILYTFDVLNSPDEAQAAALMVNSINQVGPLERYTRALDSVPLRISLENSAEPVDARIVETIPARATADTTIPEGSIQNPSVTWQKHIAAGETVRFGFYLNLPDRAGDYTTITEIAYGNNGSFVPYGQYPFTLNIRYSSEELLYEVITDLINITTLNIDDAERIDKAMDALLQVNRQASNIKEKEDNLRQILKAADEVRSISIDALTIRLKLDELLRIWETKWYISDIGDK